MLTLRDLHDSGTREGLNRVDSTSVEASRVCYKYWTRLHMYSYPLPIHFTVPPDQPANVTVISQTTSSLGLAWTNGFNGLSPITGVEIEYTAVESHGRSQINISRFGNVSLESAILTNLLTYTNYSICVFAVNAIGRSKPGSVFGATLSLCRSGKMILCEYCVITLFLPPPPPCPPAFICSSGSPYHNKIRGS